MQQHRASVAAYAVTCALVAAVIVLGVVDIVAWAPLAMTDDAYGLVEIYDIVGRGVLIEGLVAGGVWALLGVGCTVLAGLLLRPQEPTPVLLVLAVCAALLWLGPFSPFWAGFGVANTVSDEVPPYVGGSSPVGAALYVFGAAAFVVLIVIVVIAIVRAVLRRRAAR